MTTKRSRARKTTPEPVRVYRYHVRLDVAAQQKFLAQRRLSVDYYNDRVAIENGRRDAFRRLRAAAHPPLGELERRRLGLDEELETVRAELMRQRRRARARVEDTALSERALELRAELKEVDKLIVPARHEANESALVREQSPALDALGRQLFSNMRHHCEDLYWPTMGLMDRAFDQASRSAPVVRRKRFEAEGSVGGQLGTADHPTTSGVFDGTHKWLQIDRPTGKVTTGRLRVGSTGRHPDWLEFSVLMHRPLPTTGVIKNAWVALRQQGNRRCVELQLVVESGAFFRSATAGPAVAVAVGFRRLPGGGVHVATAVDVTGDVRCCVLPVREPVGRFKRRSVAGDFDRLDQADRLRSAADVYFDRAREATAVALGGGLLPAWFADEAKHMASWRSHRRLARLAGRLTRETFADDGRGLWREWVIARKGAGEDLYASAADVAAWRGLDEASAFAFYLEVWRRKNAHLYQVESDTRARHRRWRKDEFSRWVKQLEGQRVLLAASNLRAVTRKEHPEDERDVHAPTRRLRAEAAPGLLAEMLLRAGAQKVTLGKGADSDGCDDFAARCRRVLEAAGEDTTAIEALVEKQQAALAGLRGLAFAAE